MSDMEYGSDEHLDGLSRDAFKAEVRWWHERALEMEAENDSLRKELAVTNPLFETLNAANDRLIYENMKLRELVRELYQCSRQFGCDRCGYKDGCSMFDRMRELGLEV